MCHSNAIKKARDLPSYSQAKDLEVVDGGVDGLHAPTGPTREERPRGAAAPARAAASPSARLVRQAPRWRPDGIPEDSKTLAAGGRCSRGRWDCRYMGRRVSPDATGNGGGEVGTEQSDPAAPHGLLVEWVRLLCGCGSAPEESCTRRRMVVLPCAVRGDGARRSPAAGCAGASEESRSRVAGCVCILGGLSEFVGLLGLFLILLWFRPMHIHQKKKFGSVFFFEVLYNNLQVKET